MSYTEARKAIAEQVSSEYPCSVCKRPTPTSTLSAYGMRCGECYAEYVRTPRPREERSQYALGLMAGIERAKQARAPVDREPGEEG